MKIFLSSVFAVFIVLVSALAGRALLQPSMQLAPTSFTKFDIDENNLVNDLAKALTFRTISDRDSKHFKIETFTRFHEHLKTEYPTVHRELQREIIGNNSLLYTWSGRDTAQKSVMLIAHIDVVPVEEDTEKDWQQRPFSGERKDGYIYGRGSLDDKSAIIEIFTATEALLKNGFQPQRTIYLAFGDDEETLGQEGARRIADTLRSRGVKLDFILDEGGAFTQGVMDGIAEPVALIGIAQKGYLTLKLTTNAPGGHSSMPPPRTAIGKLSRAIHRLETQQLPARLEDPVREMFRYLGPEMPWLQRVLIANLWFPPFEYLILKKLAKKPSTNAQIRTTTAATTIEGGVKENVLPKYAEAEVNVRILQGDSVSEVQKHAERTINDKDVTIGTKGVPQEPSSVSDSNAASFSLLHRTVRAVYPNAVVAPYIVPGATDARHYADFTDNIYHFRPVIFRSDDLQRMHGVNERIAVDDLVRGVYFFGQLLQAF